MLSVFGLELQRDQHRTLPLLHDFQVNNCYLKDLSEDTQHTQGSYPFWSSKPDKTSLSLL